MTMRFLVVDDYPGAAEVSCILLGLLGYEGSPATSGSEALEKAATLDPDVVILDIGLPDMSGYEVARQLRRRTAKRLYIAAMTGRGTSEDRGRAFDAGIDMHVVKPFCEEKLRQIADAAKQVAHAEP